MTAREMWLVFTKKNRPEKNEYEAWAFGEDPEELSRLVLEGKKTATASVYELYAYDNERVPSAGDYSVIMDASERNALCIIKDTEVSIVPFKDVDAEHARREGEGDMSLEYWRQAHRQCFSQWMDEAGKKFTDDTKIVLERFEVVFKP